MEINAANQVKDLFRKYSGTEAETFMTLPGSGSYRQYFRLGKAGITLIGAFNKDLKENRAFISFSRTFFEQGLPVPEILAESSDGYCYLLSDLGDITLYGFLQEKRGSEKSFPRELIPVYKNALEWLPRFQLQSSPDYSLCYPRSAFDRQSMLWDLNYFKYYYLKLAGISFDEQRLEDDFMSFASFLLEAPSDWFMYRDFQSRNIMLSDGKPWFIDYQGGRKGALQYDVASVLYDAKADIPDEVRLELLDFYLHSLSKIFPVDTNAFLRFYPGFVLIRILQAMGAYGFRGYYEKKTHFLQSIPYALKNLSGLKNQPFLARFPEIREVILCMIDQPPVNEIQADISDSGNRKLTVLITSFSYKKGIPTDPTSNGGGFVFDCRALPNPGRIEQYAKLTGKDQPVRDFLMAQSAVSAFLSGVFMLIDQSIDNYLQRGFSHLMVSFGCTGGQHRSVFCAEALEQHIIARKTLNIQVSHREILR